MYVSFNKNGSVYKLESPLVNKSQYLDINYLNIMESLIYRIQTSIFKLRYPLSSLQYIQICVCKSLIWSNFIYIFNNGIEAWIKLHMYFAYYVFHSVSMFFVTFLFQFYDLMELFRTGGQCPDTNYIFMVGFMTFN